MNKLKSKIIRYFFFILYISFYVITSYIILSGYIHNNYDGFFFGLMLLIICFLIDRQINKSYNVFKVTEFSYGELLPEIIFINITQFITLFFYSIYFILLIKQIELSLETMNKIMVYFIIVILLSHYFKLYIIKYMKYLNFDYISYPMNSYKKAIFYSDISSKNEDIIRKVYLLDSINVIQRILMKNGFKTNNINKASYLLKYNQIHDINVEQYYDKFYTSINQLPNLESFFSIINEFLNNGEISAFLPEIKQKRGNYFIEKLNEHPLGYLIASLFAIIFNNMFELYFINIINSPILLMILFFIAYVFPYYNVTPIASEITQNFIDFDNYKKTKK